MKISLGINLQEGPWGGGNQFGKALLDYLSARDVEISFTLDDPNLDVIFETYLNGGLTGSGTFTRARGTVIGFSDPSGFDELRIGAIGTSFSYTAFGQLQAIALDNLDVQLVPEPSTALLLSAALLGLSAHRRRVHRA